MRRLLVLVVVMAVGLLFAAPAMAQTAGTTVDDQTINGATTVGTTSDTDATSLQPVSGNPSNFQLGDTPTNVQVQIPVNAQIQIPVTLSANLQQVVASVAAELNLNVEV